MTLPPLEIISAGAGSGKTYQLKERLGQWVATKRIAPERIVAVTFTEAAATELRERIRGELLARGRGEDALRLDQAYISTIHGFGLRVLTEFGFEAGVSPKPRLLNADEQEVLLRDALTRTDKTENIVSNLEAFGYQFRPFKNSPEAQFREDLLRVVELLRSVGSGDDAQKHADWAEQHVRTRYGAPGDGVAMSEALRCSVHALLEQFPENLAERYSDIQTVRRELHRDYRNLRRVRDDPAHLGDWKLWQELRKLRRSNRRTSMPDGYDELADAVVNAAHALPGHPGPVDHAVEHIRTLILAAQDVLKRYAEAKREAGLVDYGDMIAMAGHLLRTRPDVRDTLRGRIDCLVVDEFQDTNPLQFDLLWQLTSSGVPTVVVGDLKQAIMGFQGADPQLFEALVRQNREVTHALENNWRSQPTLMAFINELGGRGLFGDTYVRLEPQRCESQLHPLEVLRFPEKAQKGQNAVRASAVGARIQELLKDPVGQVPDEHTGEWRRLKGSDFAVLCPTHDMLGEYATVLRALGLRVRLQASGWFHSRPVQLALHALAYVVNPSDRHAALYLAVTELGSTSLQEGLSRLMDKGFIDEPLLQRLDALVIPGEEHTVHAQVADVLEALGLFDIVAHWPDAEPCRANLLRLLSEAAEFTGATREALAQGGFHGSGLETFLAWLTLRVQDSDNQPDPRVLDEDSVVLSTWHSAKGREWPVVAVCGLEKKVEPRLPQLSLEYPSFDELSDLLSTARVIYAPAFDAPEANDRFLEPLQPLAETEARRLLYVALTRARDRLMIEWPEYIGDKDKTTYWSLLTREGRLTLAEDAIRVGDSRFACHITSGGTVLPEEMKPEASSADTALPQVGRRAIRSMVPHAALTPDSRVPSGLHSEPAPGEIEGLNLEHYGTGLEAVAGLTGATLGTFLHRCFEVLGARPEWSDRLGSITGVSATPEEWTRIGTAVAQFEAFLRQRFAYVSMAREWPLLALDERGTVVSGTADLLVRSPDGFWIIDHKSDPIENARASFSRYQAQLLAYADMLRASGLPVCGIGVNWIRLGQVVLQPL